MRPHLSVRRPRRLVLAAAGCGAVAAALVATSPGTPAVSTHVLVATAPIPAGTMLDDEVLAGATTVHDVSGLSGVSGLVTDMDQARGRRTTGPVAPGEPFTQAVVGGSAQAVRPLASGERAVPVPAIAAGGAATTLAPGMRVDVVASRGEGPIGRTEVVVSAAEVLAVDPAASAGTVASEAGAPSVLLRATPRDALVITSALNFAREVRLLVRPTDEPAGRPPAPVEAR